MEDVVIAMPAPTRTVAPFLAGERPVFPTATAEPTATPEPTETAPVEAVAESAAPAAAEPGDTPDETVEPTAVVVPTPEPCAVGETGETVASESFYSAQEMKAPSFRPGLEGDFYSAHNPRKLIWLLEFDIPGEGSREAKAKRTTFSATIISAWDISLLGVVGERLRPGQHG